MKSILSQIASLPIKAVAVLVFAAVLEVSGDACFQSGLYRTSGATRALWFLTGALSLASYGLFVNLPQWNFGKLLGVYMVLFFLIARLWRRCAFTRLPPPRSWQGEP